MNLGEIKIEALKLMGANAGAQIHTSMLSSYINDEKYSDYLIAMPGAINRAFAVIENKGVLPSKDYVKNFNDKTYQGYQPIDVDADFLSVDNVTVRSTNGQYFSTVQYYTQGNVVYVELPPGAEVLNIKYRPKIQRIDEDSNNEQELDIPDNISALIPYFIKGDLFRFDEPDEANNARSWFEQGLDEIIRENPSHRVETVFGGLV